MGTTARIHWVRALIGGFLAEACLIAVVIPVLKIFGQHALLYVVPPAALVTCFLFALWVGRGLTSRFILHGPPHVFQPLGGVAVLAANTWAAFQGRQKLKVEWDNGPNASYNSADYRKELESTALKPGKLVRNVGDVDAEF